MQQKIRPFLIWDYGHLRSADKEDAYYHNHVYDNSQFGEIFSINHEDIYSQHIHFYEPHAYPNNPIHDGKIFSYSTKWSERLKSFYSTGGP